MKAKIADNTKTGRQGLPGGESTPASAPSSDTAQCDCSVCAAVRNDNFAVHGAHLRAEMTDDEDTPVRIERTSNK